MLEAYFSPHLIQQFGGGRNRRIHNVYLGCTKKFYHNEFAIYFTYFKAIRMLFDGKFSVN